MGTRLAGKVAIVTGSTAGIGRASAELFAEEGVSVVINDHGAEPQLGPQVVAGIRARGGTAAYCRANVGSGADLQALVRFAVDTYGRLDILMNNAFSGRSASAVDTDEEEWDAVFRVTVRAVLLGCKYAIPYMKQAGGGSIINLASVHGLLGGRASAAYDSAKSAIINLTRQMAVDYGLDNIRVNALCPGRILTEAKWVMLDQHPEEVRRQKLVYPLGRPGTMREVAYAALFLASDESSFVSGHALVVDGGLTAQLQDAVGGYVDSVLSAEKK